MSQTASLPALGTRLAHSGSLGTVRFAGPVDGTHGMWLGVEWDDQKRGKHDGVKDGKRYFSCAVHNAGSFIRPNASVFYGVSFLEALVSKYIDLPHGLAVEKVLLGSSNGAIEVEAVGLDKIRTNLSRLETLREVSLDSERISRSDSTGEIQKTCPGIRGLDLSKNLIPSWDVIALIASELPQLKYLVLNQNRLIMPENMILFLAAFATITELQLNATLTSWVDLERLIKYMPNLSVVEAGYNSITRLETSEVPSTTSPGTPSPLCSLNLDGNELTGWADTVEALQHYAGLERVILSSNHLEAIGPIGTASPLRPLRHLSLGSNGLRSWDNIDRLPHWCPNISSLTISGNYLVEDAELGKNARQFTIAKIPTLTMLDAAAITPRERTDCELFYLSHINKNGPRDEAARIQQHPRWVELCAKYGTPDVPPPAGAAEKQDTLSNRLLEIHIYRRAQHPPSSSTPGGSDTTPMRVLPSMSLRTLRMKVAKSLRISKAEQGSMKLSLSMPDGSFADLNLTDDTHDLSWWGVENGSIVTLHMTS